MYLCLLKKNDTSVKLSNNGIDFFVFIFLHTFIVSDNNINRLIAQVATDQKQ